MKVKKIAESYDEGRFRAEACRLLSLVENAGSRGRARERLSAHVSSKQYEAHQSATTRNGALLHVVRDCARALRGMLHRRAEARSGFSVTEAFWDLATGKKRTDLTAGFFAEMTQLVIGLEGRFHAAQTEENRDTTLSGREASLRRSDELDALWTKVESVMRHYPDGLDEKVVARRKAHREKIIREFAARPADFDDWRWQIKHIARDSKSLLRMVPLTREEQQTIDSARNGKLPFGVTPYYASLMDLETSRNRDHAIRAQVIPPRDYVEQMLIGRKNGSCSFDFMLERDTSPIDLITRRYPAIAILKPYNACPQICVYCQRNWEIDQVMADGALARSSAIERAIGFIREHPAIKEVLVTGGDPLALRDERLLAILRRVAEISHVDLIRIGTRTLVTMPMRVTAKLAQALGALREPGRREISVVTHVEHPYEVTPEMVAAVDRLRRNAIPVYNQLVYSFFVSRRFEAAKLRMLLRRVGIDPYYTFVPKGKAETNAYRVPLARILQEQKEEARLLPGSRRTDEPVYNVPGLGKNYLRAFQHRDLIAVLPTGARVYDFHPWEKGIVQRESYVGLDVPILEYLQRLQEIGEDPNDYESIWYYF
ncbi:MAG: KamA family radical SAM protein [Deltaproteobacteria bacterium]|nr:KamA family radical SAM protein [Deltaproteobacteria bacterium]